MAGSLTEQTRSMLIRTLERVRDVSGQCTDEAWSASAAATSPAIAFHAWHIARWMDYYRDALEGPGTEIWEAEGLATVWGLSFPLGYAATGMGMGDQSVPALAAVPRTELFGYVEKSINAVIQTARSNQHDLYYD